MIVTIVHIEVLAEHRAAFVEATKLNHQHSIQEEGNLRFDVLQDDEDPNKFILYEAYIDQASVDAHKQTDHYFSWRETVNSMMAKKRVGVKHSVIAPTSRDLW